MEDYEDDHHTRRPTYLIVPRRIVITLLALSGLIITIMPTQADEICYAHVISSQDDTSTSQEDVNTCNTTKYSPDEIVPVAPGKFSWTNKRVRMIRSTSRWAYWVGSIPAAAISDRFETRPTLGISVFVVCSATLFRAFYLDKTKGEYFFALVICVVAGIAARIAHTSGFSLMSHWIPRREFGRACGVFLFYPYLPVVINELFTNRMIVTTRSWASPLYIFGTIGIVWCLAWFFFGFSSHRECPYVSQKEFEYLEHELAPNLNFGRKHHPPFKLMAKSKPFWSLLIAHVGEEMTAYVLESQFNQYLTVLHGRDPTRPHYLAINLGVIIFTPLFGIFSDQLINHEYMHVTLTRKIFATFGSMGPAIFMLTAAHSGCTIRTSAMLSIVAQLLRSTYNMGIPLNVFDHAPNFIGFVYSLNGGISVGIGYAAPIVLDVLKHNLPLRAGYVFVLWSSFACTTFTYIIYMMMASGEVQPWNNPETAGRIEREAKEEAERRKQAEETLSM